MIHRLPLGVGDELHHSGNVVSKYDANGSLQQLIGLEIDKRWLQAGMRAAAAMVMGAKAGAF